MLMYLTFFFVAFGSKLLLALAMIYLVFPSDRSCSQCDGETIALRMGRLGRAATRMLGGALQRRWCPRCGWEGFTRTGRQPRSDPGRFAAPGSHAER